MTLTSTPSPGSLNDRLRRAVTNPEDRWTKIPVGELLSGGYITASDPRSAAAAWTAVGRRPNASRGGLLERDFNRFTSEWKAAARHISSPVQIALHPAYQRIVGMGERALPFILAELRREPDHWFWALAAITGANPVRPEDQGHLPAMTTAWLGWASDHYWLD